MPWHCPRCQQETGKPVFVHASEGRIVVDAKCQSCAWEWSVERTELDLRTRHDTSRAPADGEHAVQVRRRT